MTSESFDAVVIACCSVSHLLTLDDRRRTWATAFTLLRPGGVFHHADIVTNGQKGFRAPQTVVEKAGLYVNHRENIEPWWVMYTNTDFPAAMSVRTMNCPAPFNAVIALLARVCPARKLMVDTSGSVV